jgi:ElaB/YqjD/DUF883 family membrane-anchored ribosome-binding protein
MAMKEEKKMTTESSQTGAGPTSQTFEEKIAAQMQEAEARLQHATPSISSRLAAAARRAGHVSHEARMVRSLAEDAIEEGVHKAKRTVRTVRRGIERLQDIRDEGIHYVKRRPVASVALAAGIGLVAGVAAGLVAGWHGASRSGE